MVAFPLSVHFMVPCCMGIEQHFRREALERYRSQLSEPEMSRRDYSLRICICAAFALLVIALLVVLIVGIRQRTQTVSYTCKNGQPHLELPRTDATHGLVRTSQQHFQISIEQAEDGGGYLAIGLPPHFCDVPAGNVSFTKY